mgnify:CR=1 FL=1
MECLLKDVSVGEIWVQHPLFPWILIILCLWVICSTMIHLRSWRKIQRLEGVNRIKGIEIERDQSVIGGSA